MPSVIEALIVQTNVRKATWYVSDKMVVKASRVHKFDRRRKSESFVVTLGAPNYEEREFIRLCKKAKEPLPVKKVQLKFWPKKKK